MRRAWARKSDAERSAASAKVHARRVPGEQSAATKAQWAARDFSERAKVALKGHANRVPGQFSATWARKTAEEKADIQRKKMATRAANAVRT